MQYRKWRRIPRLGLLPSWPPVTTILKFNRRAIKDMGPLIKEVNAHNTRSVSSFATYHPLNIPIPLLKYSVHQSADEFDLLLHEV